MPAHMGTSALNMTKCDQLLRSISNENLILKPVGFEYRPVYAYLGCDRLRRLAVAFCFASDGVPVTE